MIEKKPEKLRCEEFKLQQFANPFDDEFADYYYDWDCARAYNYSNTLMLR
jgi:hypothetical protein